MSAAARRSLGAAAAVGIAAALLVSAVAPVAAQSASEPVFEIELDRDGSARVNLTLAFDLTSGAEKDAFGTLREDEKARTDVTTRFRDRLRSIANESEARTGREMRVHDGTINLTTSDDGEVGFVVLSVAWDGLAAVKDGHLIVTEPFASGYTPDRTFIVRVDAPAGYRLTAARPTPKSRDATSVTWAAGTKLKGFRVAFSPEEATALPTEALDEAADPATATTTGTGGQPGLGAAAAVLAILAASLAAARRYR